MPVFLAGRFGREDKLTPQQQHVIVVCRLADDYGYTIDYIESLPLDWIGNLLSYQQGLDLIRRTMD